MSSVAIGIDLGTTFSVAAIYRNGAAEIITNIDGDRLTSSVVYYSPTDSKTVVGKLAYNESLKCPRNFMFDMKRIIGRSFLDAHVQNYVTMGNKNTFALQIRSHENGLPYILLDTEDDTNAKSTPEEVSSEILRYIKDSAKTYLGFEVTEAVISVPAYFSYAQRSATKRAAEKVGFKVLKLITEPVAAAIYYTHGKVEENKTLLMVDLGGGTFDVSVIKVTNDKFEVKAIEGDMFLGGRDFDEVLFEHLKNEISTRYGNTLTDPNTKKGSRLLIRLRKHAVEYKRALSRLESCKRMIEGASDEEYEITITRNEFEKLAEPLFQRIVNKINKCLIAANLSPADIDKVVLAGGSTRMPKLKRLLTLMFGGNEPSTDLNPDEAIALGASMHAALLKDGLHTLDKYQLKEVAPHSLGILSRYDLMVPFITKGTVLPATNKQLMETSYNYQHSVIFKICEGERKQCRHNKKLGDFEICNLPMDRAGQVKFEVAFSLDEDGLLRVEASEKNTGNSNKLEIKMNNFTLCESDEFVSPEQEQQIAEEDLIWNDYHRFLIQTDRYCDNIIHEVDNRSLSSHKDSVIKEINTFKKKVDQLTFKNIDILKEEFQKLTTNMQQILN